jgi:hypothetical protein
MPYRLLTQMGLKQHKGEHQVRYGDGMTPDQTITDGAEPNSKLTAKMSVPGHELPRRPAKGAAALRAVTDTKADDWRGREGPRADIPTATNQNSSRKSRRSSGAKMQRIVAFGPRLTS